MRLKKLVVEIPEELHKALRIHAIETDRTVKELVTAAIQRTLDEARGGKRKKR